MNKKKVLLVSPYSEKKVGGIGTWTLNVINYCSSNNIDLLFLNTAFLFKPNIVRNKLTRILYGIIDSLLILIKLLSYVVVKKPNVVHYTSSASYSLYKDIVAAYICKIFNTEFIIHFRFGRIPELSQKQNSEWENLLRVTKLSSKCVVIDKISYNVLKEKDLPNIYCIPNMISIELAKTAKSNQMQFKEIQNGKIVFVGHVTINKGIFELIEACKKHSQIKELHIIGPFDEQLKLQIMKIAEWRTNGEWVKFHGELKREEVLNIISNSMLLCLPSYTEGFPNAVLEAMASGCAVVASNVGAIPEMLSIDSKTPAGICIEAGNISELEEAILKVINDIELARKLGHTGSIKVLKEYSPDIIVPQLQNVWGCV